MTVRVRLIRILRPFIPRNILRIRTRFLARRKYERYRAEVQTTSLPEIFSNVYHNEIWGKSDDPNRPFHSGGGSHDPHIVAPYVKAVRAFLSTFEQKPSVIDLGCGDFSVGSQLRDLCGDFTAVDVVQNVIDFNSNRYAELGVNFICANLATDEIPAARIAFIRQVFQHLSNQDILGFLPKVANYEYVIFTETYPASEAKANVDIPTGPYTRAPLGSYVDLTKEPFSMDFLSATKICETQDWGEGLVKTIVFKVKPLDA